MKQADSDRQWPKIADRNPVLVQTPHGKLFVQLATTQDGEVMVFTTPERVEVPLVRFQSACVFGEGLHALDCDCGVQLDAAVKAICRDGGVLTYAWEEGRGLGIAAKLDAIALQQEREINTAEAFEIMGHQPEPRTFDNHVQALRQVFDGSKVRMASRNPTKIDALRRAGIEVVDRITLETPRTPERDEYLAKKLPALGHILDP